MPIPSHIPDPCTCLFLRSLRLLLDITAGLDALQDVLTVLVELQLADDDVGWVDAKRNGLTAALLSLNTGDMNNIFETVDGSDLALATLVGATDDGDLIILSDWNGADIVLLTELLAQRRAHDSTPNAGRGIKMSLARLSPRGVEGAVDLGHPGD